MPKTLYNKENLALEQLDNACKLFLTGQYVSAISLGGCSESLTEGLIKDRDEKPFSIWHINFVRFRRNRMGKTTPSNAEILKELNWVKNTLKHHDHGDAINVVFNAKLSAFLVLKRAVENVLRLGLIPTQHILKFETDTKQYGGD